jgi:hypothetical protein
MEAKLLDRVRDKIRVSATASAPSTYACLDGASVLEIDLP